MVIFLTITAAWLTASAALGLALAHTIQLREEHPMSNPAPYTEEDCRCAPGTSPEWERRAGLLANDPECPFHSQEEAA